MAPEILVSSEAGCSYDHRVDYWALGCILYEYLAGFPPFTSPSQEEVWLNLSQWESVLTRPIFEDESLNENFTDLAWDLILHLIASPEKRYCSLSSVMSHPYFEGLDWKNMRLSEPPFVPQLESEADPSYFDDFTNPDTIQEMYSGMNLSDSKSQFNYDGSSSNPSLPPREAFIGFTYRHKGKYFSPTGSTSSNLS